MKRMKVIVCHTDEWFLSHFLQYVMNHHGDIVSCQTYSTPNVKAFSNADLILLEEGMESGDQPLPVQYISTQKKEETIYLFQSAENIYQQAMKNLTLKLPVDQKSLGQVHCFYTPGRLRDVETKMIEVCKAMSGEGTVVLLDLSQCSGQFMEEAEGDFAEVLYQIRTGNTKVVPTMISLLRQENSYMKLGPTQNPFLISELTGGEWMSLASYILKGTQCEQLVIHMEFLTKGFMELMKHSAGIYSFTDGQGEKIEHFRWILQQEECQGLHHQIPWEQELTYDREGTFFQNS